MSGPCPKRGRFAARCSLTEADYTQGGNRNLPLTLRHPSRQVGRSLEASSSSTDSRIRRICSSRLIQYSIHARTAAAATRPKMYGNSSGPTTRQTTPSPTRRRAWPLNRARTTRTSSRSSVRACSGLAATRVRIREISARSTAALASVSASRFRNRDHPCRSVAVPHCGMDVLMSRAGCSYHPSRGGTKEWSTGAGYSCAKPRHHEMIVTRRWRSRAVFRSTGHALRSRGVLPEPSPRLTGGVGPLGWGG